MRRDNQLQFKLKESEIFANYYSLEAFKDTNSLKFFKENLSDIYTFCEDIKKKLHEGME
mgnify:CR=1 FL=1